MTTEDARSQDDVPEAVGADPTGSEAGTAVMPTPYGPAKGVRRTSVLARSAESPAAAAPDRAGADTAQIPAVPAEVAAAEPSTAETAEIADGAAPLPVEVPGAAEGEPGAEAPRSEAHRFEEPEVAETTVLPEDAGTTTALPTAALAAGGAASAAAATSVLAAQTAPTTGAPAPGTAAAPSAPETAASTAPTGPTGPADAKAAGRRRRRWPVWVAAAALVVLGAVGIGGYAYAQHYADRAVPGTTVAGTDVSGMTRSEIVRLVSSQAAKATVAVTGDVTETATLADLGTTVDAERTADAALARSAGVVDRFRALLEDNRVSVVTSTDEAALTSYADSLVPAGQAQATNASVSLDEATASFGVTPGTAGLSVDSTPLADAARKAGETLTAQSATVSYTQSEPAVTDAEAQAAADQANAVVAQDVTVTSADGTSSFTADAATKASWVTVTEKDDAAPTVSVDETKVAAWVASQASSVEVAPVTGVRNVSSSGKVLATSVEAVAAQTVTNADALATAITASLDKSEAYTGAFEMKTADPVWEDHQIADGAENLAYQAAEGEKWIDINLSNKTVTAYEGASVVHGPVSVVDGASATPTVTGTFHVYLKYASQTMQGQNADGTDYRTEGVPWISYFYQGYALHGAPWRSSFGYSGSHGCLNMPVSEAKWFYDWDEIGTTVVSHY